MEVKLEDRKKILEEEIKQVIQQRQMVMQANAELDKKHVAADHRYREVCELMGLNPQEEWVKANVPVKEGELEPIPNEVDIEVDVEPDKK